MKNRLKRLLCVMRKHHSVRIDCQIALVMLDGEWFEEHMHFCTTCSSITMVKVTKFEQFDLARLFDPGMPAPNQRGYMN